MWTKTLTALNHAVEQSIPTKQVSTHSKPYWNSRLSELSKELRVAKNFKYRSTITNRDLLAQKKASFTEELNSAQRKHLEEEAESLNSKEAMFSGAITRKHSTNTRQKRLVRLWITNARSQKIRTKLMFSTRIFF
jgi:hypothetical protein